MRVRPPSEWRLLTRAGCHLCEEMAALLEAELAGHGETWSEIDVDDDPRLRQRWGDTVPVLLRDGVAVAKVRLDAATLRRLITRSSG